MTAALSREQIKAAADRAEARAKGKTEAEDFVDTALSAAEIDVEIAKLAKLPIGVCESTRVSAAKRLHMRASVLDVLVSAKREAEEESPLPPNPHWTVTPWPEPVDTDAFPRWPS
jgi:hypothetical protein